MLVNNDYDVILLQETHRGINDPKIYLIITVAMRL